MTAPPSRPLDVILAAVEAGATPIFETDGDTFWFRVPASYDRAELSAVAEAALVRQMRTEAG